MDKECPACHHMIAGHKSICPNCGRRFDIEELRAAAATNLHPMGRFAPLGCLVVGTGAVLLLLHSCFSESPADRAREAAERQQGAAKKAQDHEGGLDCLDPFDGSNESFVEQVKQQLREPKSFEHEQTLITPADKQGQHLVKMTYRAHNGFGGTNVATAIAIVDGDTCKATVISTE